MSRANFAQERVQSPAEPVRFLSWRSKEPGCVLSAVLAAFMKWMTAVNSVTPAARPALVLRIGVIPILIAIVPFYCLVFVIKAIFIFPLCQYLMCLFEFFFMFAS